MFDYKDILCNTFDVIIWYHDSYVKRVSSLPIMGCRKFNLKQNNQFYSLSTSSTCRFTTFRCEILSFNSLTIFRSIYITISPFLKPTIIFKGSDKLCCFLNIVNSYQKKKSHFASNNCLFLWKIHMFFSIHKDLCRMPQLWKNLFHKSQHF